MGLLLSVLGISSGLRIGLTFRWLIRERAAYRYWLIDALVSQRPTMLVPCHGDVVVDPMLTSRLQALAETRL